MRALVMARRPSDMAAVGLGISIGETTILSAAPDDEECRVLMDLARAAGAVRAVRVWDESLKDVDYLGTAIALAGAARALFDELSSTVIVCGDGVAGAVGPAVAERLGLPHLGRVLGASVDSGRVIARRRAGSVVRRFAAAPPLVLCAAPAPPPIIASPGTQEIEAWSLAEARLSAMELTPRRHFRAHPVAAPERVADPVILDVPGLVERMRADGVLPPGIRTPDTGR